MALLPVGNQLGGILVVQLAEVEVTARGDGDAGGEQRGRIEARQRRQRPQVPLAVRQQPLAGRLERAAMADGGQQILQAAAVAAMHVHVAGGRRRQPAARRERKAARQPCAVAGAAMQFHRQPGAFREAFAQPLPLAQRVRIVGAVGSRRQPEREAVVEPGFEIRFTEQVTALGGAPPRAGDELADLRVGALCRRQQHQPQSFAAAEFGADDQLQRAARRQRALRLVGAHHAGHRAFIGQRQGVVAELMGALHQFGRMRGAAQEAEVAEAMQLGVVGHGIAAGAVATRCGG